MAGRSKRGFASMDPAKQREIASKGGAAVSRDRAHMAQIGRKGGEASRGGGRQGDRPSVEQNGSGQSEDDEKPSRSESRIDVNGSHRR